MKAVLRYFMLLAALLIPITFSSLKQRFPIVVGITLGVTLAYWGMYFLMKRKVKITDIPSYRNLDFNHLENLQFSSITDIDRTKREDERIPELTVKGKFYYECIVTAVRDKNQQLRGIITAGRDITARIYKTISTTSTTR